MNAVTPVAERNRAGDVGLHSHVLKVWRIVMMMEAVHPVMDERHVDDDISGEIPLSSYRMLTTTLVEKSRCPHIVC